MKLKLIFLIMLLTTMSVHAQIVRWSIPLHFEKIYNIPGTQLIIADSLGTNVIFNEKGSRISQTTDRIHPFCEGKAVATKVNTDIITGFYDVKGNFTIVNECTIAHDYPYFSEGRLLVKSNGFYCYLNDKGEIDKLGYHINAYPVHKGYISSFTYKKFQSRKDEQYTYRTLDNEAPYFIYDEKVYEPKDIEFLSSINDEELGVVVIDGKVFYYNQKINALKPIYTSEEDEAKEKQLRIKGDIRKNLFFDKDSIYLHTVNGKKESVQLVFDKLCLLHAIKTPSRNITFKTNPVEVYMMTPSELKVVSDDQKGEVLTYQGKTILPPQFDSIRVSGKYGAFVCRNHKWGMICLDKDQHFNIHINKGNDVAFRHEKIESVIRVDLPTTVTSKESAIDMDPSCGCELDMPSYETRDTKYGNYLQYKCTLTIPESLPDTITTINYPMQLTYDGLKTPVIQIPVRAWHYKYFNVDISKSETSVADAVVEFIISVTAERRQGENDYPFEVGVKAEYLGSELEKLSESRYKCKIYPLREGANRFKVNIFEHGCPPSVFPFEITYVKPAISTTGVKTKEDVIIEKLSAIMMRQESLNNARLQEQVLPIAQQQPIQKSETALKVDSLLNKINSGLENK